jgi:membrane-bound metal-dependent hydrolase YbcI (DUF457 family)
MTVYEHAMFGATLALAAGAHRRHGWGLVAAAAAAAALPDWDGLTLAFGPAAYAEGHRVWGHNLLAAGLGGALAGAVGYVCHRSVRVRQAVRRLLPPSGAAPKAAVQPPPAVAGVALAVWITLGAAAGLSHLPADLVVSGGSGLQDWPVPLLWPFSARGWVYPVVPWGDLGFTLIFLAEMFALYRWPGRARALAGLTILAGVSYLLLRASLWPPGR